MALWRELMELLASAAVELDWPKLQSWRMIDWPPVQLKSFAAKVADAKW